MRRPYLFALLWLVASLTACASGYETFYRPAQGTNPELIAARRPSPPGIPTVDRSQPADPQVILDAYARRGYVQIGNALFNSGHEELESAAVAQGQKVGADLVLILNPRYTGSTTTSVPLTTPTTTTAYTNGRATAYGSGGSVTAYGNSTTTIYGTTTNYIPITVHRSDYGAVYFVKQRFPFGAFFRNLNDSERQEMQTNKGLVIRLVVDNSPAFNADVLTGDVVTAVDGMSIINSDSFSSLLREREGQQIVLSIIRRGQRIEKTVQLGS